MKILKMEVEKSQNGTNKQGSGFLIKAVLQFFERTLFFILAETRQKQPTYRRFQKNLRNKMKNIPKYQKYRHFKVQIYALHDPNS